MPSFSNPEPTEVPTERPCGDMSTVQNKEIMSICPFCVDNSYGQMQGLKAEDDICDLSKVKCFKTSDCELRKTLRQLKTEIEKLEKELQSYKCQEKFPNQCRCVFRCLGNDYCEDAERAINRYKKAFEKIKYEATEELKDLEADTNIYACLLEIINIINKAKEI